MISVAATGYFTAFSLILAIGAQNAFVLRQGLVGRHVFALCLLCALSDAVLISLGVAGFGYAVTIFPAAPGILSIGGAGFLLIYGWRRFLAAIQGQYHMELSGQSKGLTATLVVGAALTWLNPHVYLDTLGLIGAVSTKYPANGDKLLFALAAVSASFTFFFGLGYGARMLAPLMQSVRAWRVLDVIIGVVMWFIAVGLLQISI